MSSNPSARIEKLCWPVMIAKLKNKDKILKHFENNRKIKNLAKIQVIKIFKTTSLSQETFQYPYFKL